MDAQRLTQYFQSHKRDGIAIFVPETLGVISCLAVDLVDVLALLQPLDKPVPEIIETDKSWDEILPNE
jgi:hypothetical protein